jgi:hypothetical protein
MTFDTNASEKMRIDSSGNVSVGGFAPNAWQAGYKFLQFSDATGGFIGGSSYSGQYGSNAYINSSATWVYGGGSYKASRYEQFNGYHAWYRSTSTPVTGNDVVWSQAMTLDASGNLVVGYTSTTSKLQVYGGSGIGGIQICQSGASSNAYNADIHSFTTGNGTIQGLYQNGSGNVGIGVVPTTLGKLEIQTGTTAPALWCQTGGTTSASVIAEFRTGTNLPALTILGNGVSYFGGNVGIGTSSPVSKLQILDGSTGGTLTLGTAAVDGGTSTINMYGGDNYIQGSHRNLTSPFARINLFPSNLGVDSAGAISFSTRATGGGGALDERMRITSQGLVGIGTSSPATALDVNGQITSNNTIFSNGGFSGQGAYVQRNSTGGGTLGSLLSSGSVTFETNLTERVRISSTGNLLVGTTTNTFGKLAVWGTQTNATYGEVSGLFSDTTTCSLYITHASYVSSLRSDATLAFGSGSNGTERMRIDTSGNVLVGTTSTLNTSIFTVAAPSSRQGSTFQTASASYWPILCWNADTATPANLILFQVSNGSTVGSITYNGSLTLYNTTSDQRLKTNIVDAPLGNIDDIKVRSFDWIENGNHQPYGMIAQELNEVAPYAVHQPTNPDEMMGVDYSKLVPMMIKEIQDLKQRIATLENK